MYPSYKSLDAVENGGPGQQLWKIIEAKGVVPLAWGENGFREITNSKRPVRKPEDLEGMKVRVVGSPIFIDTFRALGANPVNMNWGEAQTAFQTGTVDGQENPVVSVIQPFKLWTVHKNITIWHYAIGPPILGVSKITWDSLSPADREIVKKTAVEVMAMESRPDRRDAHRECRIGQVTPPVAVNLYVAANIAKLSFDEISRAVWPFVPAMLLALFIVTQWPGLSTFLPALFGLK